VVLHDERQARDCGIIKACDDWFLMRFWSVEGVAHQHLHLVRMT